MAVDITTLMDGRNIEGGPAKVIIGQVQLVGEADGGQVLTVDSETKALATIAVPHHMIHLGIVYHISYKSPDASPVADNATVNFVLTLPATREVHCIFDYAGGGDTEFELYEGCTVTGGTAVIPQNKNRSRPNAAQVTVVRDATVNNAGLLLENVFAPGGTGPQAAGNIGAQRDEWILNPGSKYLFRVTNRAGTAQPISVRAEWYGIDE